MKKIFSVIPLMGLIVVLSACGKETITMQEIYDASHLNAQLENHESVYVQCTMDGERYEEQYLSKEYSYSLYVGEFYGLESDFSALTTDHAFYSYSDGNYTRSLLLSPDGLSNTYRTDDAVVLLSQETVQETIQTVTKKDHYITVTSFMDQETIEASGEDGLVSSNNEYVLDAKTHALISAKCVTEYDDGTIYEIVSEISYDTEIPEGMKALVEYDQQTEDLRTLTVVSNPGTEKEISESIQVPKGLPVSLESDYSTDEALTLYADAACTEPYVSSEDCNSDTTVYVKWGE